MKKTHPLLYHLSFNKALPTFMYPRQPAGMNDPDSVDTKPDNNIFREDLPPRISFGPSVELCFKAIWPNIQKLITVFKYPHLDMYVYGVVNGNANAMYTPEFMTEQNKLWDAHYTQEHCFLAKTKVAKLAKIRIFNTVVDKKEVDMVHPYGNKDYKAVKGSPSPRMEVLRVYDTSLPLIMY